MTFGTAMAAAAGNPLLWCAAVVQLTATPIAEFQSQVPFMLKSDETLSPTEVNAGTTAWHLGILVAVLSCGALMDRASMPARGLLIGSPVLVNAGLFGLMAVYGVGAGSTLFAGMRKLPLILALGASGAPSNYLVQSTTVGRWVHPLGMATVSAVIDTLGYVGTIVLYQVADAIGPMVADGGDGKGVPAALFVASGGFACVNLLAVVTLFTLETMYARPDVAAKKRK